MPGLLTNLFGYFVRRRNHKFDLGAVPTVKVNIPVISVGNLSVGGSGKTPFTIMLARMIQDIGLTPGIIGRGYKKKQRGEVVLHDGSGLKSTAEQGGDEMYMMASILNVPVIANEIKSEAARSMAERFNVDCILVDDGFQHRRLERDLDIVLIDDRTIDAPQLMPSGRLREPLSSLQRADLICYTGEKKLQDEYGKSAIRISGKSGQIYNMMTGKKVGRITKICVAASGIGNPHRFLTSLEQSGIIAVAHKIFGDHYKFSEKTVTKLINLCYSNRAGVVITTEKDAVKLKRFGSIFDKNNIEVLVLPVHTEIVTGYTVLLDMLDFLSEKQGHK